MNKLIKLKKSGGGDVMCACLYQKSVCKEYRTEGVYFRYILRKRISVLAFSGECSKVKDEFVVGKTGSDGY